MPRRWWLFGLPIAALLVFWCLPVITPQAPLSAVVLDRDGELLGATVATDGQWRFRRGPVPERFAIAIVAAEDRRFWSHPGVDPLAVVRAARDNLQAGHIVSGASTLTMQTVRLGLGNPPRTVRQKAYEALLALRLEAVLSKDEILRHYAAHAPYGGNTVGLHAASVRTFGRKAETLSWGEAATLAVLPNAPALIHPNRNRDALKRKRDALLQRLADQGHLSKGEALLAMAETLPQGAGATPSWAPHLVGRGQTTLDGALQRQLVSLAQRHHQQLKHRNIHNLAIVVADVPTGQVRGYVGNIIDAPGGYVDVVHSPRSTGSLLKPFLYGGLLERGELLPHQLVPDVPTHFGGFVPENFDRVHVGALPAAQALARSRNVPAVWMLGQYGVEPFKHLLQRGGMTTLFRPAEDYGLSLILGGAEGTLWELTELYRSLSLAAMDATAPSLHLDTPVGPAPRTIGSHAAWLTLEALREEGSGIAWKTGTSFGFRDAWSIGVTPQWVVGVWTGNASGEGQPGLVGREAAGPLLFDVFGLLPESGWFPPREMPVVEVCQHSGMLAGPDCAEVTTVETATGDGPTCSYCRQIHVGADERRVHSGCAALAEIEPRKAFVLPPAMAGDYQRIHPWYQGLPPWRDGCETVEDNRMRVVSPGRGTMVFVPTEVDGQQGRVLFEARHHDDDATVHWHMDGSFLGSTRDRHQMALSPPPGHHQLTLVDHHGEQVQHPFRVADAGLGADHSARVR